MVAFIGNALRGKVNGENFDESIGSRQNLSHQSFALYSNSSFHILPRDEYFSQVRLEQSCMLHQEINTLYKITFVE